MKDLRGWGTGILGLLGSGLLMAQSLRPTPGQFFTVDRSKLPNSVRNLPLDHLSSGALMLLDQGGNLVRPPSAVAAQLTAPAASSSAVTLDPRVGSNLLLKCNGKDGIPDWHCWLDCGAIVRLYAAR